jgi:hypothetical protein
MTNESTRDLWNRLAEVLTELEFRNELRGEFAFLEGTTGTSVAYAGKVYSEKHGQYGVWTVEHSD